jgi:hypothetical protein
VLISIKKAALSRSDLLHAPPSHPNRVLNHQSQGKVDNQSQLHILVEQLLSDGVANEVHSAVIRCRQQASHWINHALSGCCSAAAEEMDDPFARRTQAGQAYGLAASVRLLLLWGTGQLKRCHE